MRDMNIRAVTCNISLLCVVLIQTEDIKGNGCWCEEASTVETLHTVLGN